VIFFNNAGTLWMCGHGTIGTITAAIESGLVKIPRTPTDDNTEEAVPKYRNLWHFAIQAPFALK
jgi:proline racemase